MQEAEYVYLSGAPSAYLDNDILSIFHYSLSPLR